MFSGLLVAQTQSRVAGLVSDDSGAVVVGARLTAKNVQTGETTVATTGDAGNYLFPALLPGGYEVSVEKAGFKRGAGWHHARDRHHAHRRLAA